MRVSLEWLSEYVDLSGLSAETIAEALTNAGLEVEAVEKLGGGFTNVVVGKCVKLEPHPNADKLRLATIQLSPDGSQTTRVVCGAQNLAEGMLIAFAQDGAQVINRKDGTPFTLGKAVIRGVESCGMICSLDELGLETRYPKTGDGIWHIADYATESQLGQDLKTVLGMQDDVILHTAPTANRGDQMSLIGIAREVAALFDRPLTLPDIPEFSIQTGQPSIQVQLDDPTICSYYGGLMLKDSKASPAPAWMSRRLEAAGTRSINVLVDVTNYVMLEMGQPLHAFDQRKFGDASARCVIGVRRAKDGESFITLDDESYMLTSQAVLVTMNDQPVALGGVMGGQNTEISDDTTDVFLEAAYFDPACNRKSAKSIGIRTESSARFERGVDPVGTRRALFRAAQLIQKLTGATFVGLTESAPPQPKLPQVQLRLARLEKIIGMPFEAERVKNILTKLGFTVSQGASTNSTQPVLSVMVPSWRMNDVTREIDLIEEVVRIVGYDTVPYTLPAKTASVPFSARDRFIDTLQDVLQGMGLTQVMTSSLIGSALLERTGMTLDAQQQVAVINSHSVEHTLMRQSLIPNLLEVAKHNQAQGIEDVWVYELGKTYFKVAKPGHKQTGVNERLHVAILLSGAPYQGQWHQPPTTDFYTLKGMAENLLGRLLGGLSSDNAASNRAPSLQFKPTDSQAYLHPGKTAEVLLSGKPIGTLGELHPLRQSKLKFRQPVYLLELNLEPVFKAYKQAAQTERCLAISPYPAMRRDMALLVPDGHTHQEIVSAIHGGVPAEQASFLRSVDLFDEYKGERLGEGKRSLAYRLTFQSDERTLTDAEVDTAVQKIRQTLTEKLPIQLR